MEKIGHDFGTTPFGFGQVTARREREEARVVEEFLASALTGCRCGDPGDCQEC